jgi:Undecaprenyl-phosphate glucose phosphotransferase
LADTAARSAPVSHHAIGPFVAAADFVCLVILGAAAGVGYELWVKGVQFGRPIYLGLGCLAATLTVALLHSRGLYQRSFVLGPNLVAAILKVWVTVFALLAVAAFLIGISDHFSRGALLVYFAAGGATLIGVRRAAREVLSRAIAAGTLRGRRVLVIGDRNEISLGELGASLRHHGYSLISCFTFDPGKTPADLISQIPWSEVVDLGRKGSIDEVMLAVRWSDSERVDLILKMLRLLPISVRLLPDDAVAKLMRQPIADIGLARAVELQREPLKWWEQILKRKFDIVVASGALLLLLPLIVTVAVLIKLDSAGPVFFRQTRVGFNGRQFRIWKFRTMTTMEDGELVRQATKNDTRVTQVGRWLRATSVDEIPQLINVVTGDMSLVGPRPHAVAHDNQYDAAIANYAQRRHVKPGITGWAQVCGFRGETPTVDLMLRRVEHDLWYINNWSFWLDSMIVVRTAMVLMRRQNAY